MNNHPDHHAPRAEPPVAQMNGYVLPPVRKPLPSSANVIMNDDDEDDFYGGPAARGAEEEEAVPLRQSTEPVPLPRPSSFFGLDALADSVSSPPSHHHTESEEAKALRHLRSNSSLPKIQTDHVLGPHDSIQDTPLHGSAYPPEDPVNEPFYRPQRSSFFGPTNDDFLQHQRRSDVPSSHTSQRSLSQLPRSSSQSFADSSSLDHARRPSSFLETTARHRLQASSSGDLRPADPPFARPNPTSRSHPPSIYGHYPQRTEDQGPLLDQTYLKAKVGAQANLLSHAKTLELYRANAKKTNEPEVIHEFAVFMMEVAKELEQAEAETGEGELALPSPAHLNGNAYRRDSVSSTNKLGLSPAGTGSNDKTNRQTLLNEAVTLLRKLADRGFVPSQVLLADCYTQGIGTTRGKQDYEKAFPLFILAGKHGDSDACFKAGQCCENGWGCRKDAGKAVMWYKKAAATQHPGAMFRLGLAEINNELGTKNRAKDGFKWLKRTAELADDHPEPCSIQALHELALLHERGIEHVVFVDLEYAAELLAKASELAYAPSAYKLGECYEYGKMGCPQDSALSIHYYNIAAQQNHAEACFALTAWYLVGSPGVLPQSDTEAYLWAKKAAEQGLAKAEYAVGYFTEVGMGTYRDLREALNWFRKAADHGDQRAIQRLKANATQQAQILRENETRQAQMRRQTELRTAQERREDEVRRVSDMRANPGLRTAEYYGNMQGGRSAPPVPPNKLPATRAATVPLPRHANGKTAGKGGKDEDCTIM